MKTACSSDLNQSSPISASALSDIFELDSCVPVVGRSCEPAASESLFTEAEIEQIAAHHRINSAPVLRRSKARLRGRPYNHFSSHGTSLNHLTGDSVPNSYSESKLTNKAINRMDEIVCSHGEETHCPPISDANRIDSAGSRSKMDEAATVGHTEKVLGLDNTKSCIPNGAYHARVAQPDIESPRSSMSDPEHQPLTPLTPESQECSAKAFTHLRFVHFDKNSTRFDPDQAFTVFGSQFPLHDLFRIPLGEKIRGSLERKRSIDNLNFGTGFRNLGGSTRLRKSISKIWSGSLGRIGGKATKVDGSRPADGAEK
jgi:hypothetical protein